MVKINKFFIPYIILLLLLVGEKSTLIVSFGVVILHEIAHYLTARYLGFDGFNIELLPFGTVLRLKELDEASPKEDMIISIAGPLVNLVLAIILYVININYNNLFISELIKANLSIGLFNLIPAFPLDGGRILRDICCFRYIYKKANRITVYFGIVIGTFFMFMYLYLFFNNIKNFNMGIIAIFILVCSFKEKERTVYIIMGDVVKKKYKFISRGYIENKSISIYHKKDLLTAMSILDKNKYNIFNVLDNDMKSIDIFYEEELLEAIKKYGNITIEELIKIREKNK
ncbi:MAG: M50 family metallopeptidase [Bacillota bacterium]|nr:M50 family metallopeptidase [Bacillota bacterium]